MRREREAYSDLEWPYSIDANTVRIALDLKVGKFSYKVSEEKFLNVQITEFERRKKIL